MNKVISRSRILPTLGMLLLLQLSPASGQPLRVYDIQYDPANPGGPSPYANQRVTVAGIVTGLGVNAGAGGSQSFFIQDRDTMGFHGLFVRNSTARTIAIADSVVVSGLVSESNGQTQISAGYSDTVTTAANAVWTPLPATATIAQLVVVTSAESFEGMLVNVPFVRVAAVQSDGVFITDGTNQIFVGGYGTGGRWIRTLNVGDSLRAIRGNIRQMNPATYQLEPRSDGDFQFYGNNAPIISNVSHTPAAPTPSDRVTFAATVMDIETSVSAVWLSYTINTDTTQHISAMTLIGSNRYETTAGPWWYNANIRYKIYARDSEGAVSASAERSFVVQFAGGIVPLQYIIDYPDTFRNRGTATIEGLIVYVQDRSTRTDAYLIDTLNNVGLYISEAAGPANFNGMRRGTYVRMYAAVTDYHGALQVSGASGWTVLDTSRALPSPTRMRTGDTPGLRRMTATGNPLYYTSGSWLDVRGRVLTVDQNVGGGTNILMDDGSGTVALRIWDNMRLTQVLAASGDTIGLAQMAGRIYYIRGVASSYNNDFQMLAGYFEDFTEEGALPPGTPPMDTDATFVDVPARVLDNDVAEQMTITYGAPPLSRVQVRVFNLKGQVVATLVDKRSNGIAFTTWDGRDEYRRKLPLGTYIIQVQSNNNGKTKSAIAPIVIGTKL